MMSFCFRRMEPALSSPGIERTALRLTGFILFLLLSVCRPAWGAETPVAPSAEPHGGGVVFVTSNDWHTGIVIARADLPDGAIPETADFSNAAYFEFAWGDADYYPARDPGLFMALGAAFPGPALVHLSGLPAHPSVVFPTVEWVAVRVTGEGMARLIAYLHDSFARAGAVRVSPTGPGLYAFSLFYPATGEFHLFNTCNSWTARGLAAAGLAVDASGVQSAEDVMELVRPLQAVPEMAR